MEDVYLVIEMADKFKMFFSTFQENHTISLLGHE